MKELIQNVLVYVVIVSVLRGLISNPKYSQYFAFFSSTILILLMLSPLLSFFQGDTDWYSLLEEKILQMDLDEVKNEMKIADGSFENIVQKEYKEAVKSQVQTLANQEGVTVENLQVTVEKSDQTYQITGISGQIAKEENAEGDAIQSIETIQIGQNNTKTKEEDTSADAKKLKNKIAGCYVIEGNKVHLWK